MDNPETMEDLLTSLKLAREAYVFLDGRWSEEFGKFVEDHKDLKAQLEYARNRMQELDSHIRDFALSIYENRTDKTDKHIGEFIEIKNRTVLEYDESKAFQFAKSTGIALTLDKKEFERIVKVMKEKPNFVTIKQQPTVYIKKDL